MKFSIIIPTYNRAHLLAQTLKSLADLNFAKNAYEVIVVDNNSTDQTKKLVQSMIAQTPYRLRYAFEKQQGRTFASLTGFKMASYPKIVFVDDDILVQKNLLKIYELAYQKFPQAVVVGGPVVAKFEQPPTNWFIKAALKDCPWIFGEVNHGHKVRRLPRAEGLFAGNMSINLANFSRPEEIFSTKLGRRVGKNYLYAEDFELCLRLNLQKQLVLYVPQLLVENVVEANRLSLAFIWKRLLLAGVEHYLIEQRLKKYPNHDSLAPRATTKPWWIPTWIGYWWLGPQYDKSEC